MRYKHGSYIYYKYINYKNTYIFMKQPLQFWKLSYKPNRNTGNGKLH